VPAATGPGTAKRMVRGAVLITLVYVPVGAVLLFVRFQTFAEPQAFAASLPDRGSEWYSGGLAIAGITLWGVAALAALAGGMSAFGVAALRPPRRFLFEAAVVSVMLGADDAFQLHDPRTLGIPTAAMLAVEAAIVIVVVVTNRDLLLRRDVGLLVVALGFGALWIVAKGGPGVPMRTALESGAKFATAAGWSVYIVRLAWRTGRAAAAQRAEQPATAAAVPTAA
jgi:hypothetical protein